MDRLLENTIIFDLDGTLTDSAEGIIRSIQYMQEKMGMDIWKAEDLTFVVGPPLTHTFTEVLHMSTEEAEQGLLYFRERYSSVGLFENKLYSGIIELLDLLQSKGKRLAVATSKKEESALRILSHFKIDHYFEMIGGDNREIGRDTKAKVIQHVLDSMGVEKQQAIMVGDRKFDIAGAHEVGIPCIAIEYGYGDVSEFLEAGADYILSTPEDIGSVF